MTLKSGEHPVVPTNKDDLLIEALRTTNRVCGAVTEIGLIAASTLDDGEDARSALKKIHDIAIRQFSDLSGVHLFIAAHNIGLALPEDLQGKDDEEGDE